MAQQQPRHGVTEQDQQQQQQQHPIKYGDVFLVSEDICNKPIAPLDAAAMQSAENLIIGQTQKGGPASVMQSAATKNVEAGVVDRGFATDVGRHQGMSVTQTMIDGQRIITESIGDQVVARYVDPNPKATQDKIVGLPAAIDRDAVTIGEALEASALSAGDKPITRTDAAAIQAAEMLATKTNKTPPGGLGAEAQSAALRNEQITSQVNKTTLGDILMDATQRLADDKPATIQDAEKVIAAEVRNDPKLTTNLGGVGESVAAAARMNQQKLKET